MATKVISLLIGSMPVNVVDKCVQFYDQRGNRCGQFILDKMDNEECTRLSGLIGNLLHLHTDDPVIYARMIFDAIHNRDLEEG